MIPTAYIIEWVDADGVKRLARKTRRAEARGLALMLRAQGMRDVTCNPVWEI